MSKKSIVLKKGKSISLKKEVPSLKHVRIGLGWDSKDDLDVSAFGLNLSTGKPVLSDTDYFVFYNNLETEDGAIKHLGDARVGGSEDADDESILVDLDAVAGYISEIAFIVTIYNAGVTFKKVKDSYIRIVDNDTDTEIARYSLNENFGSNLAVQFGSLVRTDNGWDFSAVGNGYNVGLTEILENYGAEVE